MLNLSNQILNFIQSLPNKFEEIHHAFEDEQQKQNATLTVYLN
jgi:hypothetical protein